jgi:hypothetical protein
MRFGKPVVPPEVELSAITKLSLGLGFLVVCFLLVVGLGATFREWMRYRAGDQRGGGGVRKKVRTRYVDAWKIAGERMQTPKSPDSGKDDPS